MEAKVALTKFAMNRLARLMSFRSDVRGSATIFGLYMFLVAVFVLGIALDRANGWRVRQQLQVASDAAALAGAANLNDLTYAKAIAVETGRRNLPDPASLVESDIVFGSLDPDTLEFVVGPNDDGEITAVAAFAGRTAERGNSVSTLLLSMMGMDSLNVNAGAVAVAAAGDETDVAATCHDALFLSTSFVQTGGGNDFEGAVCVHGQNGVRTGGGDHFNENVRFTAEDESDIILNSYSPSTLERDDLVAERSMQPVLLPQLEGMRTSIFDDLWISEDDDPSLWSQGVHPQGYNLHYKIGEYEITVADYDGILPGFIFDDDGKAQVNMRNGYWGIQPGEIEPNTIYLNEDSIQFSGGVDIQDAAFVSKQNIGVGGGSQLFFDDVYFIGTSLNMSGSITWGDRVDPCNVDYGVYVFGTSSLSLGGWYSGASVNGMVGAAPSFNPGGGMTGTGVYFETDSNLSMGGAYDLFGCDEPRDSEVPILDPSIEGDPVLAGSLLYR